MGLLYGENCMILTSTVFAWITRVTDGQTDRRTDGIAIAHARLQHTLSRAKIPTSPLHTDETNSTDSVMTKLEFCNGIGSSFFLQNIRERKRKYHKSLITYFIDYVFSYNVAGLPPFSRWSLLLIALCDVTSAPIDSVRLYRQRKWV